MHTSAPPPDPAIGQASLQQIDLANREFDEQQKLVDQYSPLFAAQMQQALQQQTTAQGRSDSLWDQYQQHFQPLETQLADTATSYNSAGRREQAAQEASAGVGAQFDNAKQAQQESLQAAGVQPGSGKALALTNDLNIREARAKAGAADAARTNVENTGLSLLGNAVNVGRGLPATQLAEAGFGAQQGGAAQGSVSGLSGLTAAPLSTSSAARVSGINGLIGLGNLNNQAASSNQGFFGDLIGAGASAYGMYQSSKGLKNKIAPADPDNDAGAEPDADADDAPPPRARKGLKAKGGTLAKLTDKKAMPVDAWKYKPGAGDGGTHIGPYAEDVHKAFGDKVAPKGKAIDMHAMEAKNAEAIAQMTTTLKGLKTQLAKLEHSA